MVSNDRQTDCGQVRNGVFLAPAALGNRPCDNMRHKQRNVISGFTDSKKQYSYFCLCHFW